MISTEMLVVIDERKGRDKDETPRKALTHRLGFAPDSKIQYRLTSEQAPASWAGWPITISVWRGGRHGPRHHPTPPFLRVRRRGMGTSRKTLVGSASTGAGASAPEGTDANGRTLTAKTGWFRYHPAR